MTSIKMAEKEDLPEVVTLCLEGFEEIKGHLAYEIDPEEVGKNVVLCWHQAPCFLLKDGDKTLGFAGLMMTKSLASPKWMFREYMFYILKPYRNIANLGLLCDAARDFCDSVKSPLILNYIVENDLTQRARLMKRMGFRVTGITGTYE